jgi:hypothetical protein
MSLLRRHPWLPLALLFGAFLVAWAFWLWLASRHTPERVPLEGPPSHDTRR